MIHFLFAIFLAILGHIGHCTWEARITQLKLGPVFFACTVILSVRKIWSDIADCNTTYKCLILFNSLILTHASCVSIINLKTLAHSVVELFGFLSFVSILDTRASSYCHRYCFATNAKGNPYITTESFLVFRSRSLE